MFVVSIPSASATEIFNPNCVSYCGNGRIDLGEQCDDGNNINGDGCSSDCKIENCTMLLTKTDSPDPVAPGGVLKYTLKLKNIGSTDCTGGGVQLKEYYDSLTVFVSASPAPTSGNNLWNFGIMHPGNEKTLNITMNVSPSAPNCSKIVNKACFWTTEYNRWVCINETTNITCYQPYCGDGIVKPPEQCELPGTTGNSYCPESQTDCKDGKLGTRPAFGDCNSTCGCKYLPFIYSCVKDECGAQCGSDGDCQPSSCSLTFNDYCTGLKLTEYNTNKILDSTEVSNSTPNSCLGSCSCTQNSVTCNPPETHTYCVKGVCGAACSQDSECDDGNPDTTDTCLGNCSCQHIPQLYCGDGEVSPPEQCELPGSFNNDNCSQTPTSQCLGAKLGVRDAYGNCNSSCGCTEDPFTYQCVKGQCGALCDRNQDCQPYCVGKFRYFNGVCRTCYDCSCAYSYENCDSKDGWYNGTETRWVSTGECTEKEQVKNEYRDYSCAPVACQYVSKYVVWVETGKTRNKDDGTACDDGQFCTSPDTCTGGVCGGPSRDCSLNNLPPIGTCLYQPDGIPFTWDSSPGFTSVCDEELDMCTNGSQTITHECSIEECDAQCEEDGDCPPSSCSETFNDYCIEELNKLVEYNSNRILDSVVISNSTPNTCLPGCECTDNPVECNPPETQSYCVKGVCNASCEQDSDCNDYDANTIDTCNLEDCSCHHEYVPSCGNGIVDYPPETCELPGTGNNHYCAQANVTCDGFKAAIRDDFGNCNSTCGCVEDPLNFQCVPGTCGADCNSNDDCIQPGMIGTCEDCKCHYEPYVPFCGNGIVDPPNETCELPDTFNNNYCAQTILDGCAGYKVGTRDAFGNCDSGCGCTEDPFIYICVKGQCGATCSGNSDCQPYCSGSFRYFNGVCRTCSTCQCAYSYENCDSRDGWVTTTDYQWVPTGECTEKEQVKHEFRDYSCAPVACQYDVTDIVWENTGNVRDKADETQCNDGQFCTVEDSCSAGVCLGYERDCSDQDECTYDSCNEESNQCQHVVTCNPEVDSDGDGVPDTEDVCLEVYGTACNGCPNPCTGCASMICSSGPPTCAANNSLCSATTCPADGCGLGGCTQMQMADYPASVQNTCGMEGMHLGICSDYECVPECSASELCLPRADHVVFSQVMYDEPGSDVKKEWLELYNPTGSDVDMSYFMLYVKDSLWTMPEGSVIKAGSYFTIARNETAFFQMYGCYPDIDGFTKDLTNTGSKLTLVYGDESKADMVAWEGFIPGWDIFANDGKVIARIPVWQDTDSPLDWVNNTDPMMADYEIVIQTDKPAYYPGENMTIMGQLVNKHCTLPANLTIHYTVEECCMSGQIQTGPDGAFSLTVEIPPEMPVANYTLNVSYGYGSGQNVSNSTAFRVAVDMDGDGYDYSSDCNDSNPSIHPGAVDICGNGIDEDCSGADAICPQGGGVTETFSFGGGGGGSCTPSWTCTDSGECQPNGTQAVTCIDQNKCNSDSGKPAGTRDCTYTPPVPVEGGICVTGTKACAGDNLMVCVDDRWAKAEACQYGCKDGKCKEGQGAGETVVTPGAQQGAPLVGMFLLEPSSWPYWLLIAFVIILVAWFVLRRGGKKKQKGSAGFCYRWKRN